jgi:hypothetical protein
MSPAVDYALRFGCVALLCREALLNKYMHVLSKMMKDVECRTSGSSLVLYRRS